MANKLPISRLQRDLSDSSAQRSIGEALGHTLVGYSSTIKGLGKVDPDKDHMRDELMDEWSVLTEAVQTVLRRYGAEGAYEIIKAASRGRSITQQDYIDLVMSLELPEHEKERLQALTPLRYLGYAEDIAKGN